MSYSNKNNILEITHEKIAIELGTAREVIRRVLEDFERRQIVSLSRGKIMLNDINKLNEISKS